MLRKSRRSWRDKRFVVMLSLFMVLFRSRNYLLLHVWIVFRRISFNAMVFENITFFFLSPWVSSQIIIFMIINYARRKNFPRVSHVGKLKIVVRSGMGTISFSEVVANLITGWEKMGIHMGFVIPLLLCEMWQGWLLGKIIFQWDQSWSCGDGMAFGGHGYKNINQMRVLLLKGEVFIYYTRFLYIVTLIFDMMNHMDFQKKGLIVLIFWLFFHHLNQKV